MKKPASCLSALALAFAIPAAYAGVPAPVTTPPAEEPFVTGFLSLAFDTHFISYGHDIWAAGDEWEDALFHPTLEVDFNLGGGWQLYLNTWFDVNDNVPDAEIGGYVQEMDVNVGFYYTMDKWKFQLGYGAWMYSSQIEHIVDAKVTYNDGVWNPFVMLHGRTEDCIQVAPYQLESGLVGQIGIAPSKTFGPVTLSLPVTASFDTEGYHGGDAGFAYVSAGLGASIPLFKHTTLNLAATYYHTNEDVIPVNPEEDFVTGTAGITISF